jgi:hypothetical protein
VFKIPKHNFWDIVDRQPYNLGVSSIILLFHMLPYTVVIEFMIAHENFDDGIRLRVLVFCMNHSIKLTRHSLTSSN